MKKKLTIAFVAGLLIAGGIIILGTTLAANHYLSARDSTAQQANCKGIHTTHQVSISRGEAVPKHTYAILCDTLTISNRDDRSYLVAFGEHGEHDTYDGVTERALSKNESLSVELIQTGTFVFHDHLQDKVHGDFTVKQ